MKATSFDAITLIEVTKVFSVGLLRKRIAVDDLTLSIPQGQVVALLGPNGSGKSTTLKMLLGFLKPTRGHVLVCGMPATNRIARTVIGYLPENPRFQKFLRAREALSYLGGLLRMPSSELDRRIDELLELVGLRHFAGERVGGFSKGMTQRLAIAQALLNRPSLLIFDEPMSGLDPLGRIEIRTLMTRIHEQMPGATLLFSTHVLADAEALCSHVALLRQGKLARSCPVTDLIGEAPQRYEMIIRDLSPAGLAALPGEAGRQTALGWVLDVEGAEALQERLFQVRDAGGRVIGITSQRRSLEEALFGAATSSAGGTR